MVSLRSLNQVGSSVGNTRVRSFDAAKSRMVHKLRDQITYWNDGKGQSYPDGPSKDYSGPTKRSLWFKKMDLGDDWMLQLKMGQQVVYMTPEAKAARNGWFAGISEHDMLPIINDAIKEIESGGYDDVLKPMWDGRKSNK